jgi:hypothetical protein
MRCLRLQQQQQQCCSSVASIKSIGAIRQLDNTSCAEHKVIKRNQVEKHHVQ